MKRKAMTKTLALVVTGSVLLITAAILSFMVRGGLSDVVGGSNQQACVSQVEAKCSSSFGSGSGDVTVPSVCEEMESSVEIGGKTLNTDQEQFTCP